MTSIVRVQRVAMPSGVESSTLLRDGAVVEPVDRFLAHLTAIERSPNTVRAYAHDLRDFFAFLTHVASRGTRSGWRTWAGSWPGYGWTSRRGAVRWSRCRGSTAR